MSDRCEFLEPAPQAKVKEVEDLLGVAFPPELLSLLGASDGVRGEYGHGLIWSLDRIESENRSFRNDPDLKVAYMPFTHLLFFADAGNGDQFCYAVKANGEIHWNDIYVWNHENDSRSWCAPNLKTYLEWWLTGKLSV